MVAIMKPSLLLSRGLVRDFTEGLIINEDMEEKIVKHRMKYFGMLLACLLLLVACGAPGAGEDVDSSYEEGEESGEYGEDGLGEDAVEEDHIMITLYHSNEDATGLTSTGGVIIESITPENVLQIMIDLGEMSSEVQVLSFQQSEEVQGLLELDLSTGFNDFLAGQGTSGELIVLGSLVNTFLSAFDGESIRITVGGGALSTPHQGEITEPLTRF